MINLWANEEENNRGDIIAAGSLFSTQVYKALLLMTSLSLPQPTKFTCCTQSDANTKWQDQQMTKSLLAKIKCAESKDKTSH